MMMTQDLGNKVLAKVIHQCEVSSKRLSIGNRKRTGPPTVVGSWMSRSPASHLPVRFQLPVKYTSRGGTTGVCLIRIVGFPIKMIYYRHNDKEPIYIRRCDLLRIDGSCCLWRFVNANPESNSCYS